MILKNYVGEINQINGTDENVYLQYAYMTKDKDECVLMNIFSEYSDCKPKETCKTTGNKPCIFPFTYRGAVYDKCKPGYFGSEVWIFLAGGGSS